MAEVGSRRRKKKSDEIVPDVPVNFRRLLGYLRPYWKRMGVAMVALLFASLVGLVFPLVIQQLLDTVLEARSLTQLNRLTFGLLVIFAVQALLRFVEGYLLAMIGERIILDLRAQLYRQLTRLSLGFYSERRTGELVSRISTDTTKLRQVLTGNVSTVLSQSVSLVGSLVLMILINWQLLIFILVVTPVIIGIGAFFGLWLRRISTELQDRVADSTVVVEETISGIRIVKSFTRETYENQRYGESQNAILGVARRYIQVESGFGPIMAFIGFGSLAGFLWFGGREVLAGNLSVGELIAFLFYGAAIAGSIASFVELYAQIQEAIGATKRIFEIIDMKPAVDDAPDAHLLPPVQGHITFENVSFAYPNGVPVLHDISLAIAPGESVAIVGPSGAGKTTLANLMARFYDPTGGFIRIDGTDIRAVTQESLRSQVGLVPQDTQLFGGSVRDNMRYGRLDATEDEIVAASEAANAHGFVIDLPQKYETIVGERGVKLSGGQRQRVAIARAILKDPRILILDEATSSLDSASEALVQEALERLMQGRTTIIIAHRLSTIKNTDRIVVLDKGRIAEIGTHAELMDHNGIYAGLYNMQFREESTALVRPAPQPV